MLAAKYDLFFYLLDTMNSLCTISTNIHCGFANQFLATITIFFLTKLLSRQSSYEVLNYAQCRNKPFTALHILLVYLLSFTYFSKIITLKLHQEKMHIVMKFTLSNIYVSLNVSYGLNMSNVTNKIKKFKGHEKNLFTVLWTSGSYLFVI